VAYIVAHRGSVNSVYVRDIACFLAAECAHLQWDRWVTSIKSIGLKSAVYYGLSYAAKNGARNIPEGILTRLRPCRLSEKTLLFYYERNVTEKRQPKVSYLHTWFAYPGLAGKARLLRKKFFPSQVEIELRFGIKTAPRYLALLVLRPFAIFFRGLYFFSKDILTFCFK